MNEKLSSKYLAELFHNLSYSVETELVIVLIKNFRARSDFFVCEFHIFNQIITLLLSILIVSTCEPFLRLLLSEIYRNILT